jgi:hypothetical protein
MFSPKTRKNSVWELKKVFHKGVGSFDVDEVVGYFTSADRARKAGREGKLVSMSDPMLYSMQVRRVAKIPKSWKLMINHDIWDSPACLQSP